MNCQLCGQLLPPVSTAPDDSHACTPTHQRQRRSPKVTEPLRQLQEARLRIQVLERIMRRSGLPLPTQIKRADPATLWTFVAKHNVARTFVEGVIEQKMLRPIQGEDGNLMLDAEGQYSFWQIFHDAGPWRTCPDCPHDGVLPLE
jgi:hypothetical protein